MMKPQDIVVLLKLTGWQGNWSYASVAQSLAMSPSEVHACVKRATESGLLDATSRRPRRSALLEFLLHGLRYVYPAVRGGLTRGVPTAHAAAPLASRFAASGEPPPVWPDPDGEVRGETLVPLFPSVPRAARMDPALHELLALTDALRGGRARERQMAAAELTARLA